MGDIEGILTRGHQGRNCDMEAAVTDEQRTRSTVVYKQRDRTGTNRESRSQDWHGSCIPVWFIAGRNHPYQWRSHRSLAFGQWAGHRGRAPIGVYPLAA